MTDAPQDSHKLNRLPSSVVVQSTDAPTSISNRLSRVKFVTIAFGGIGLFHALIMMPFVLLSPTLKLAVMFAFSPSCLLLVGSISGAYWTRLVRNERHYTTDQCFAWEVTCYGTDSAVALAGLDECDGWRDIEVCCKSLPVNPEKWLPISSIRVQVERDEGVFRRVWGLGTGKSERLRAIDREGRPLRIVLSHQWPDEASEDLPWVVQVAVRGDPSPPETLTATRFPLDEHCGF